MSGCAAPAAGLRPQPSSSPHLSHSTEANSISNVFERISSCVPFCASQINNKLVVRMLDRTGRASVSVSLDGTEMVERYESGEVFDCILLDQNMTHMNGTEACKRVRALERERGLPRTPVIFVTGNNQPADLVAYAQVGGDGIVRALPLVPSALCRWPLSRLPPGAKPASFACHVHCVRVPIANVVRVGLPIRKVLYDIALFPPVPDPAQLPKPLELAKLMGNIEHFLEARDIVFISHPFPNPPGHL